MKALDSRIRKLQGRLCPDSGQQRLWFMNLVNGELALDLDRCAEILDEGGFLPRGPFCVVNLCGIPDGLNAKELEKFLRKNGAQICGFDGDQKDVGLRGTLQPSDTSWSNQPQMASDGT